MSIVKSKHASNYTVIPNDVFKQGLSIEAIGLLMYFLSLPHDWVIYKTQLHTQLNIGSDKTDRIFKELQKAGYLLSVRNQNNKGLMEWEHVVYDKPFNGESKINHTPINHEVDNHRVDNHAMDNPLLLSKEELSKEDKVNKTKRVVAKATNEYATCVDFWLLEFHTGWTFNGQAGKSLKSIISKIKKIILDTGKEPTEQLVVDTFKHLCVQLPEWFKNKDLQVIDSKFNEIITHIKNGKSINKDNNGKPISKYHS